MKTNNYTLLYDDACPLCVAYTKGFVKAGLLQADNRKAFSQQDPSLLQKINISKAVNEIPLIDNSTGTIYYGIDALLEILDQKIPLVKTIGNFSPFKWFLLKLYKFISYNRKVIVAKTSAAGSFDCSPAFNIPYRILFLAVFLIFNTAMLFPIHRFVIQKSMFANSSIVQLQMAHTLLVAVNVMISFRLSKKEAVEYLGQVNMLALTAILLNIPLILLNKYAAFPLTAINNFFLGMITVFIVKEYVRRMRYAGIMNKPWLIYANGLGITAFLVYLFF
ncbi:MAG: DCC1-like thiol-disulfide oxidoreductase family protein [Ferruginibacter sp.]